MAPPIPLNPKLYEKAKEEVYKKYKVHSAYRSGALVRKYKELGGKYKDSTNNKSNKSNSKSSDSLNNNIKLSTKKIKKIQDGLPRWFAEKWTDIGHKDYPVYRPLIRINKGTPLTYSEIDKKQLKKQIELKQKLKHKTLPKFLPKKKIN